MHDVVVSFAAVVVVVVVVVVVEMEVSSTFVEVMGKVVVVCGKLMFLQHTSL